MLRIQSVSRKETGFRLFLWKALRPVEDAGKALDARFALPKSSERPSDSSEAWQFAVLPLRETLLTCH
jgi:hypothetical protein